VGKVAVHPAGAVWSRPTRRLGLRHRHREDLAVLALHQQRHALRLALQHADLLDRTHRLAIDGQQHVASLDAGTLGRAADLLDHQPAVDARLRPFGRLQGPQ
jgi:hypothetical protein